MKMFLLDEKQEQAVIAWLHSKPVQDFLATDPDSSTFSIMFSRTPNRVIVSAKVSANNKYMYSGQLCEYPRSK